MQIRTLQSCATLVPPWRGHTAVSRPAATVRKGAPCRFVISREWRSVLGVVGLTGSKHIKHLRSLVISTLPPALRLLLNMSLLKACLDTDPGRPLVHVDDYKLCMKGKIVCPQCDGDVVGAPTRPADAQRPSRKMGFRNAHHFAHKCKTQCDSWTEPMTAWHKGWQDLFEPDNVEVIMTCNSVKHIADVEFQSNILEIQHSKISATELMQRESFYTTNSKSLTWIVDGRSEKDCFVLGTTYDGYAAIWGAYAPGEAARCSWWWHTKSDVLIDTGEGLFNSLLQRQADWLGATDHTHVVKLVGRWSDGAWGPASAADIVSTV